MKRLLLASLLLSSSVTLSYETPRTRSRAADAARQNFYSDQSRHSSQEGRSSYNVYGRSGTYQGQVHQRGNEYQRYDRYGRYEGRTVVDPRRGTAQTYDKGGATVTRPTTSRYGYGRSR